MRTDSAMLIVSNFDRASRQSLSLAIVADLGRRSSRNIISPSSSHCFVLVHLYHSSNSSVGRIISCDCPRCCCYTRCVYHCHRHDCVFCRKEIADNKPYQLRTLVTPQIYFKFICTGSLLQARTGSLRCNLQIPLYHSTLALKNILHYEQEIKLQNGFFSRQELWF